MNIMKNKHLPILTKTLAFVALTAILASCRMYYGANYQSSTAKYKGPTYNSPGFR